MQLLIDEVISYQNVTTTHKTDRICILLKDDPRAKMAAASDNFYTKRAVPWSRPKWLFYLKMWRAKTLDRSDEIIRFFFVVFRSKFVFCTESLRLKGLPRIKLIDQR